MSLAHVAVLVPFLACSLPAADTPEWIWGPAERAAGQRVRLSGTCEIAERPVRATVRGVADFCDAALLVNGERVATVTPYSEPFEVDVLAHLREGTNELVIEATSVDGPAAVFLELLTHDAGGKPRTNSTGESWRWANDDGVSQPVSTFGAVAASPWGSRDAARIEAGDDYTQWKRATGAESTDPSTFQVPEGFAVERLRAATEEDGSWVAMTFDPRGRLVVARESKGLLRFAFDERSGNVTEVETIEGTLAECRGIVFVGDVLYAMANNDKGLFRLEDANADDRFDEDEVRRVATFEGEVGHGRNQITLGPDGGLYAIFGDSVHEPEGVASRVPSLARPTRLERTRSGFVARMDPETEAWEVLVRGLRNPYGITFDRHGEMFTYDADAEYDMGSPWYRPTRIDHLIVGADFGWRRVTREWPPYVPDRPDMPRPTLDIGKGSPTAVAWGGESSFPPAYRDTLFALDWAYGRILAVHLAERGSGYAARAETFLRGRPANVTDVEFGPDGAMYFVTGGRRTQSALYRVQWTGGVREPAESTAQQRVRTEHAARARARRRQLEALQRRGTKADVDHIWRDLDSPDPWIAHAARVALEWQPVDHWVDHALDESSPSRALEGLLALVRVGGVERSAAIVERLAHLLKGNLDARQTRVAVFVAERLADDEVVSAESLVGLEAAFDGLYPHPSYVVNRRLGPLLKRLGATRLVPRTLPLVASATGQTERMQHLFLLRDVRDGWTEESRRTYFAHLREMDAYTGGEGMPTFRKLIREEAVAAVPEERRAEYEGLLASTGTEAWRDELPTESRPFVRKWTLTELGPAVGGLGERDLERGRRMFAAARWIACHRVESLGGTIGPDLTSVARRFRPRDVLASIVDPSRVIDEKYRQETFVLADGRVITGRPLSGGDFRSPRLRVAVDPLDPTKVEEFEKSEIEVRRVSEVSPMPADLLNGLTRDEILDLLAWLDQPR